LALKVCGGGLFFIFKKEYLKMASPQTENGFTKIANELLEAFSRIRISGEENQVFWVILRKTYGFKKIEDNISLSQFMLSTGINKPNICRALSKLITKNMIIKNDNKDITSYRIQKDYSKWLPLSKLITIINIDNKKQEKPLSILRHTKDNTKENIIVPKSKKTSKPQTYDNYLRIWEERKELYFNLYERKWKHLTEKDIKDWKEAFPNMDIKIEFAKMKVWLLSHPKECKSKRLWRKFANGWISRGASRLPKKAEKKLSAYELSKKGMKQW